MIEGGGLEQFIPLFTVLGLYILIPLILLIFYGVWLRPYLRKRRDARLTPPSPTTTPAIMPEPLAVQPPPAPVAPLRRSGEYRVRLSDGDHAEGVEVLAILRDSADDRLMIQFEGVGYRSLVDQPEVKKRFSALMKELAAVIAEPAPPRPVAVPPPAPTDDPLRDLDADLPPLDDLIAMPPADEPPPAPPVASAPPPPLRPPSTSAPLPGDLPDYRALGDNADLLQPRRFVGARRVDLPPVPELNIAASIEAYLQYRILHTPDYPGWRIHVHSAPGGGVTIEVDNRFYEAVDDVSDPDARAFIRQVIEEWQERQ